MLLQLISWFTCTYFLGRSIYKLEFNSCFDFPRNAVYGAGVSTLLVSSGNLLEILFPGQDLVEYLIELLGLLSGLIVSKFLTEGIHCSGYSILYLFKNV